MTIIPSNFADSLRGPGHVPPVLAAVAPDLRRLLGDLPPVPAEIAALLARLGAGEAAGPR